MPQASDPKITVTPTDRDWLRFSADVLRGGDATKRERDKAAAALERLAYRADLVEQGVVPD